MQFADGRVDRWVALGAAPEDLPATTARLLAESLAAAHAERARLQQDATAFPMFSFEVTR